MQLQYLFVNGICHVHAAGCAVVARTRSLAPNASSVFDADLDSQEAAVLAAWSDIVAEYEGERDHAIAQGADPAKAQGDCDDLISGLRTETRFKPCASSLPQH